MQINITVDFGQGYLVSLTPQDAKALYSQLGLIFAPVAPPNYPPTSFTPSSTERGFLEVNGDSHGA